MWADMKMDKQKIVQVLMLSVSMAGCALGPDYQRPPLDLPPAQANLSGSIVSPSSWWTGFNDVTLNRVIDEALKNNHDLAIAAARVAEYEALRGIAAAEQTPSAYAAATHERNRNSELGSRTGPGQPLQSTTNRVSLNISYEIDFWGKYRRATDAARAELLAVESNRDALRLSLTAEVVRGYFNLVAVDARINALEHGIQRGEEALAMQKKRFDAGVTSEFDYQQRVAELDAGRVQLPPLQSQRGQQERALAVLLGRSPRALLAGKVERDAAGAMVATATPPINISSERLLRRPDIVEAEQKLIAANARIGVARAAYFPSISLTGLLGGESSALGNLFSGPARIWNFAGNLTQPLWSAGRVQGQVDVANARNEQALAQYQRAIANAFREAQDAIQAQSSARDVFEIETRRVASLDKSWTLAKLRYEHGVASQLDVIDAERNLLLAELNRIEAERALRAAIADLYRALGG